MINEILLRRKNKVLFEEPLSIGEPGDRVYGPRLLASLLANIKEYGYTLDDELISLLDTVDDRAVILTYDALTTRLKELTGADRKYNLLYPNFPRQVMEADSAELFLNAILHYWSDGTYTPESEKESRPLLEEIEKLTVLKPDTLEDLQEIGFNLLSSKTNLSMQDYEDLAELLRVFGDQIIPETIPLKENAAFLAGFLFEKEEWSSLFHIIKTPTDLLRMLAALNGGDISLASKITFRKLKRPERRLIMDLLANLEKNPAFLEDLFRYRKEWIIVGEIVHPGEYSKQEKYKAVSNAFLALRNGKKPATLRTSIYEAIKNGDSLGAASLLTKRPGEFARNLDKLLRDAGPDAQRILDLFEGVAQEVSAPVLLQLLHHFSQRDQIEYRSAFPKGTTSYVLLLEGHERPLDAIVKDRLSAILEEALIAKFSEKEPMGNVYVSDSLKNFVVPFSQRSASAGKKIITRGSRIPIDRETSILRAFLWWTNLDESEYYGRVDLDLSASVYNELYRCIDYISFSNLHDSVRERGLVHSGDITNGGPISGSGVAEFIDIDLDKVKELGGRYIVFQCYSFTGQPFDKLPNSSFGWMNREDMDSGEVFEPLTVVNLIELSQPTTRFTPVIFDLFNREFIWADLNIGLGYTSGFKGSILESNVDATTKLLYAMTHLSKPDLYTLACLNARARGNLVTEPQEADIIFDIDPSIPERKTDAQDMAEKTDGVEINEQEMDMHETDVQEINKQEEDKEVKVITPYDIDFIVSDLL